MLLCLPFTDGAFNGHFGKVYLKGPPLSTVVKLLCLQHVTNIECEDIQGCVVSISVRCNDYFCCAHPGGIGGVRLGETSQYILSCPANFLIYRQWTIGSCWRWKGHSLATRQ